MSDRVTPKLVAVAGFVSAVALVGHFVVAGPPASFTSSQKLLVDYASQHDAVVTGAWLDGIGSILLILTVIGVAQLAGAAGSLAGRVLMLAGGAVVALSLVIDSLLIAATQIAAGSGPQAALLVQVAHAVDYVFPIPNTFWAFALGLVVLRTRVLPAIFGYVAAAFGLVELLGGTAALYSESVNAVINPLFLVMVVWNVAAGIVLLMRREKRTQVGREQQVAAA